MHYEIYRIAHRTNSIRPRQLPSCLKHEQFSSAKQTWLQS